VKILFALPLASVLAWALISAAQTTSFFSPLRAEQLIGMKVEALDGQKVGTVHNLVLDTRSGELKYVVIGYGGFVGMHPTLKLAPARMMSAGTTKRDTLAIFTTAGHWNAAPVFKPSTLASFADPERARKISLYFQPANGQHKNASAHALSETGADNSETNAPRPELRFANDIIGKRVVNQKQEKIGEILDLLVGFGPPHPAFAIIGSGRVFRHGQKYAVPLSALKPTERENKWLLETDDTKMEQATPFNEQAWNAAATEGVVRIYRYSKTQD
jgi:sporulation protein YlmC with PRC-barrel domain